MTEKMTREEWLEVGQSIWGMDWMSWTFQCPACGHVATMRDYYNCFTKSGLPDREAKDRARSTAHFSCIGRYDGHMDVPMGAGQPCNYTNGGLLCMARLTVRDDGQKFEVPVFLFYDPHPVEKQDVVGGVE